VMLLSSACQHRDANLNNREMTEKELAALGRVVTKSAVFENTLDWAIPLMTKIPDEVYALVSKGKTLGPKVELLEAILTTKVKKSPYSATIKIFLKHAKKAVEKRNVVVHGLWSPGGHGDSLWIQLTVDLKDTKSDRHGGSQKISLGEVLADEKFTQVPEAIRFHMQVLYQDPRGMNVRNELAHGILAFELLGLGLANIVVHSIVLIGAFRLKPTSGPGA